MKIQNKYEENYEPETQVEDRLELLGRTIKVESEIKEHITSDFILAKLDEKNKEGITEMVSNAYYGVNLLKKVEKMATEWKWNQDHWQLFPINEHTKNALIEQRKKMFNSFMVRVYMTVILNRNVAENHMLNLIANMPTEEPEELNIEDIKEKLKTKLEPKEEK